MPSFEKPKALKSLSMISHKSQNIKARFDTSNDNCGCLEVELREQLDFFDMKML